MRNKKKLTIILLLLVGLAFLLFNYLKPKEKPQTAVVIKKDLTIYTEVSGKSMAEKSASLAFSTLGQLEKIASTGAVVRKGDFLGNVSNFDLYSSLQQAHAALNKAYTNYYYYLELKGDADRTYVGNDEWSVRKRNEARLNAESAYSGIDVARWAVSQSESVYGKSVIRAPFDGVVGKVNSKVGDIVGIGASVLEIIDPTAYYFEAEVDEIDVGFLMPNQPAIITLDAFSNKEFTGNVSEIDLSPHLSSSGGTSFYVKIKLNSAQDYILRPGLNGNAKIFKEVKKEVLTVPLSAVTSDDTGDSVQILDTRTGKRQKKTVTFGAQVEGDLEVTSGVSEGETLVLKK